MPLVYGEFPQGVDYETAWNNYYAVLRSSYVAKQEKLYLNANIATEMENNAASMITTFLGMVQNLANFERESEKVYINKWIASMNDTPNLQNQLKELMQSQEKFNFSKAMEIIELYRMELTDDFEKFEDLYNQWNDEFQQFSNNFIKKTMEAKLAKYGADLVNLTPEKLIDELCQTVQYEWYEKYPSFNKNRFETFLGQFKGDLINIVKDMADIRDDVDNNFRKNNLSVVFKIKEPKELHKSIQAKIIDGLVNGLPQETALTLFSSGASTARALRQLIYKTNRPKQLVPTETDVYAIVTASLEKNSEIADKIKGLKTDTAIRELLSGKELENNFIIHYSSKDLTIAAASNRSSLTAKLKGEGSLDSKIVALEQMGKAAGEKEAQFVHELIFEAINSGKDLLYSQDANTVRQISESLAALSFTFMFDDFEEQFQKINKKETTSNELNLYTISGHFYSMADILDILYEYIQNELNEPKKELIKKFINVGFKPAKENYYLTQEAKNLSGQTQWEYVRDKTIQNTMMKLYMNTTLLKDLTYKIGKTK